MSQKAVIFDMDGLLIDSEPLWQEAGIEALSIYGVKLSVQQYHSSTGLRTPEWIEHWFSYFQVDPAFAPNAISTIEEAAMEKISQRGTALPGVHFILDFFRKQNYRIGIASSSPQRLIDMVITKLGIGSYIEETSSAGQLAFGKPHPEVFINCAELLQIKPANCLVFEDSFNGLIAAKAAKMKCVVVPAQDVFHQPKWSAADLKLGSLVNFNELLLQAVWMGGE
ncbi:hexitol phosphatase HxpB [Flavihumibacter sp. UBA7668]|uniref:hexitol phosphatase HxpB n=1 Tax=Flavihumibacter sp. UBA7668 TaxID=1946542 RepID=UPI0025C0FC1D|nr:hexitol phosphatase HxpB [Flavihumibacter sp. UBA7668]